jgi:hypothetical protein
MRSDAAPPLSQAIAPVWTGAHSFRGIISTAGDAANPEVRIGRTNTNHPTIVFANDGGYSWSIRSDAGINNVLTVDSPAGFPIGIFISDTVAETNFYLQSQIPTMLSRFKSDSTGLGITPGNYVSQFAGWAITGAGAADFRNLYVDQMHARTFIVDLEQALAGLQRITPSVTEVGRDFTAPVPGGTGTIWLKDLGSAPNMAVGFNGDIWLLRTFVRAAGSLTITNCWGVLTGYVDGTGVDEGLQSWVFNRSSGGAAGAMAGGAIVPAGAIALDHGVSGEGWYEVNTIDGVYGDNAPYAQIARWTSHPATGTKFVSRWGNLAGLGIPDFGLMLGNDISVPATTTFDFRSTTGTLRVGPIGAGKPNLYWDGTVLAVRDNATNRITLNSSGVMSMNFGSGNSIVIDDISGFVMTTGSALLNGIDWFQVGQHAATIAAIGTPFGSIVELRARALTGIYLGPGIVKIIGENTSGPHDLVTVGGGSVDISSGNFNIASGWLRATGTVFEAAQGFDRVDIGVSSGAPRIILEDGGQTTPVWEIIGGTSLLVFATPGVAKMTLDASGNATLTGTIKTAANVPWNLGAYTAGAPSATGYVTVTVNGVNYKFVVST